VIGSEVFGGTGFCSGVPGGSGGGFWSTVFVLVIRMMIPESSVVSSGSGDSGFLITWFWYDTGGSGESSGCPDCFL